MNKKQIQKQHYFAPWCEIISAEATCLICASPLKPELTEDDWDSETIIDDGDENEFE